MSEQYAWYWTGPGTTGKWNGVLGVYMFLLEWVVGLKEVIDIYKCLYPFNPVRCGTVTRKESTALEVDHSLSSHGLLETRSHTCGEGASMNRLT
jgi:hypothetical protein